MIPLSNNTTDIFNTKYNIVTLKQYLHKDAIQRGLSNQQARQFVDDTVRKHKRNLFGRNSLAQSLGKRSFTFFCLYYLQDYFIPKPSNTLRSLAPIHYQIWDELEDMFIHHKHDKELFILPRGSAKTTVVNTALSVWLHCYKNSIYTLMLANTENDAIEFVNSVKIAFNND